MKSCKNANVSRETFSNLFSEHYNIINWIKPHNIYVVFSLIPHYNVITNILKRAVIIVSITSKVIKTGVLFGVTLGGIHAVNKLLRKNYTAANRTWEYKGFSWDYPHGKINYIKRGEGRPLLLLHNVSASCSNYEFSKVLDRLAEDHCVYAIDLPGCGHSEKPKMTYTAFTFVQLIYMFINEVIGEETDIIATGLSGAYAVVAKKNFSDKIGKIVLVDPVSINALAVTPEKKDAIKKDLFNLPITGTFVYNVATSRIGNRAYADSLLSTSDENVSRETSEIFCESAHIGGNGGKYLFNSIKNRFVCVDIRDSLKDLDGLSIIYGAAEDNRNGIAAAYHRINEDIKIYSIPDCGSLPHYQKPAEFLTVLGDIL